MGKERKSKRQLVRDEKRKKKRDRELGEEEAAQEAKRQRREERKDEEVDYIPLDDDEKRPRTEPDREFFGMLADEEQEYFRRSDELLELNDFATVEDRDIFLENVYREARGKELKLASSQSCSRLMERLILLSNTRQKKHLFEAFASHFVSLVTHRFASHCCETLFIQSAPVVTRELGGLQEENTANAQDDPEAGVQASMEELFLLTLDEL
jgi:nucleolar protein 9